MTKRAKISLYLMPLLGFSLFFYFSWNLPWRLSFLFGIVGFFLGMFVDKAFRVRY